MIIEIGHNQDVQDRRLYFTIIVSPFDVTKFCYDSGENLNENTWYHFTAVVGSNGNTGYLNGEELIHRRYNNFKIINSSQLQLQSLYYQEQ